MAETTPTLKTIEIWKDSRQLDECRGCHARIEFARNYKSGARMPFDEIVVISTREAPRTEGRILETVDLTRNHFATCPNRDQFTRRKEGRSASPSRSRATVPRKPTGLFG